MRNVVIGEPNVNNRRSYFTILNLDGTPALGEAGGQPQFSLNGGVFNTVGFGVLISFGFGQYYADLATSIFTTVGDVITTVYIHPAVTQDSTGDIFNVVTAGGSGLPSLPAAAYNSYASVFQADQYFQSRLNSDVWLQQNSDRKLTALREATRLIDRLNYLGQKADPAQPLQFPRGWQVEVLVPGDNFTTGTLGLIVTQTGKDVIIPTDIAIACCEIALKLLEGVDLDLEIESLGAESKGYGNVKTVYNPKFTREHLLAGIPSAIAWGYITPYLRDPLTISISRSG